MAEERNKNKTKKSIEIMTSLAKADQNIQTAAPFELPPVLKYRNNRIL